MQFDVETPLPGYNGTVGAVTFVAGRARVSSDQKAELAYLRRHGYKITPVAREPAGPDEPGPAPANQGSQTPEATKTAQAEDEPTGPPTPGGEPGPTATKAAARLDGERPEPTGTGEGLGPSAPQAATQGTSAADSTTSGGTGGSESGAGEQPRKPPKNAPVATWTAYARHLGVTDGELGGKTKNELVELVDQYEKNREADQ